MEEKRIYSVSPAVIVPVGPGLRTIQPYGRQSAQHAHAVGMVRWEQGRKGLDYEFTTTILLQCRDSRELIHVAYLLNKAKISIEMFCDRNDSAYGLGVGSIFTAVATYPVEPKKIFGILDYLPLLGGPTL